MRKAPRCQCGRLWKDCVWTVQRTSRVKFTYYRCQNCSTEWTVREDLEVDTADPITSEEVLAIHLLLSRDLTVEEMTQATPPMRE
jgi:hypothetical protein